MSWAITLPALLWLAMFATKADAESLQPPRIREHSLSEVAVYQGDELELGMVAEGQNLQFKWEKDGQIFCRAAACQISMNTFGLGLVRFTAVVSNEGGSSYVEFAVRVVQPPSDHRPALVRPRRIAAQDALTLGPEDWVLKLLKGRAKLQLSLPSAGFKSRDLGGFDLPVDWSAGPVIETGAQSGIQLGRRAEVELIALEQTVLKLDEVGTSHSVALKRGVLRVRELAASSSLRRIRVGPDLEIEAAADADLLVEFGKDGVLRVQVLRGSATVMVPMAASKDKPAAILPIKVMYGQSLIVATKEGMAPEPQAIDVGHVQPLVIASSRDYLPEYLAEWSKSGPYRLLASLEKTPAAAKDKAREFNARHDYFATIEVLAPFWNKFTKDADALVLMALAYAGIYLQDDAMNLLRDAAKVAPESPVAFFQIGELHARVGNWRQAARAYDAADRRDDPQQKQLQFKLGDAWERAGVEKDAARAYKRVAWYPPNDATTLEAENRLDAINDKRTFTAAIGTKLFYDSNILRVGVPKIVGSDGSVSSNYGTGYQGNVDVRVWPYRGAEGWTYFGFEAQYNDYIKPPIRNLSTSWQRASFASELGYGGERRQRYITVGLDGSLGADTIGSEQQFTRLTGALNLGSPWLYGLGLKLQRSFLVDIQPGRERMIEPIRWELAGAGDYAAMVALYTLYMTPWEQDGWRMRIDARNRQTKYRAEAMQSQNFGDTGVDLTLTYEPHKRSAVNFVLSSNTRSFAKASDGRRDQDLILGIDWGYSLTPDIRQILALSYETQKSSRSENSFKRKYASYSLQFSF